MSSDALLPVVPAVLCRPSSHPPVDAEPIPARVLDVVGEPIHSEPAPGDVRRDSFTTSEPMRRVELPRQYYDRSLRLGHRQSRILAREIAAQATPERPRDDVAATVRLAVDRYFARKQSDRGGWEARDTHRKYSTNKRVAQRVLQLTKRQSQSGTAEAALAAVEAALPWYPRDADGGQLLALARQARSDGHLEMARELANAVDDVPDDGSLAKEAALFQVDVCMDSVKGGLLCWNRGRKKSHVEQAFRILQHYDQQAGEDHSGRVLDLTVRAWSVCRKTIPEWALFRVAQMETLSGTVIDPARAEWVVDRIVEKIGASPASPRRKRDYEAIGLQYLSQKKYKLAAAVLDRAIEAGARGFLVAAARACAHQFGGGIREGSFDYYKLALNRSTCVSERAWSLHGLATVAHQLAKYAGGRSSFNEHKEKATRYYDRALRLSRDAHFERNRNRCVAMAGHSQTHQSHGNTSTTFYVTGKGPRLLAVPDFAVPIDHQGSAADIPQAPAVIIVGE